jgi:hypothetical protein
MNVGFVMMSKLSHHRISSLPPIPSHRMHVQRDPHVSVLHNPVLPQRMTARVQCHYYSRATCLVELIT